MCRFNRVMRKAAGSGRGDNESRVGHAGTAVLSDKEAMVFKGLAAQRLVALFLAAWLLFNFPLLGLWDVNVTVLGIPLFPAALFTLWALLIGAIAWLMERVTPQDD